MTIKVENAPRYTLRYKRDLMMKLELLLNIDDVRDFDFGDNMRLFGKKERDDEGDFIWGEVIATDNEGDFSDVLFGFAFSKKTDLDKLSDYIIGELTKWQTEKDTYLTI